METMHLILEALRRDAMRSMLAGEVGHYMKVLRVIARLRHMAPATA